MFLKKQNFYQYSNFKNLKQVKLLFYVNTT